MDLVIRFAPQWAAAQGQPPKFVAGATASLEMMYLETAARNALDLAEVADWAAVT